MKNKLFNSIFLCTVVILSISSASADAIQSKIEAPDANASFDKLPAGTEIIIIRDIDVPKFQKNIFFQKDFLGEKSEIKNWTDDNFYRQFEAAKRPYCSMSFKKSGLEHYVLKKGTRIKIKSEPVTMNIKISSEVFLKFYGTFFMPIDWHNEHMIETINNAARELWEDYGKPEKITLKHGIVHYVEPNKTDIESIACWTDGLLQYDKEPLIRDFVTNTSETLKLSF